MSRKRFSRLVLLALPGFVAPAASDVAAGDTIVTGTVVYGDIDESEESSAGSHHDSIFDRGVAKGEPIAYVWVGLRNGNGLYEDSTVTKSDGSFELTVSGSPSKLNLVTKAKNDYVKVKDFTHTFSVWPDKVLKTKVDVSADWKDGVLGDIEVVDDDTDTFTVEGTTNYISRAFRICTVAQICAENIEDWTGETLPRAKVRLGAKWGIDLDLGFIIIGWPWSNLMDHIFSWYPDWLSWPPTLTISSTAFYWQWGDVIFLSNIDTSTFWHEYGHFVEDKLTAYAAIPCYFSHAACEQMTNTLQSKPNLCWPWLEGLATWIAAVNSHREFGDPASWTSSSDREYALGYASEIETSECSSSEWSSWDDPRAVESVVANVLWDLVDDENDDPGADIPEIADRSVEEVWEVIMETLPFDMDHNPCSLTELNTKLMGLDQFWEMWRRLHEGPVPELYAAFAYNGVDIDAAEDTEWPDSVSLDSPSHPEDTWRNSNTVHLTITDGDDDVSGAYYYYVYADTSPSTGLTQTDMEAMTPETSVKTEHSTSVYVPDGPENYIHVRVKDLAGHPDLGPTDYGPVKVDTVSPGWIYTDFPASGDAFVLGSTVHFEWSATDDLSGVYGVTIRYEDPSHGISIDIPTVRKSRGSLDWFLDPDEVVETSAGYLTITLEDIAGNSVAYADSMWIVILSPFDGPFGLDFVLAESRLVSADFDADGLDDVVCSGLQSGVAQLHVLGYDAGSAQLRIAQSLSPGMRGGDLAAADVDRDGDLDLVAAGRFGSSSLPELCVFENDGSGYLTLALRTTLSLWDVRLRVADLLGSGEPVVVAQGIGSFSSQPEIHGFNAAAGFGSVTLGGIVAVDGDFEIGDVDADGDLDLVSIGEDTTGAFGLNVFLQAGAVWSRIFFDLAGGSCPCSGADLDLGDIDADGDLDVALMYADSHTSETQIYAWNGAGFDVYASPDSRAAHVSGGDGHVLDIMNDGAADVLAFGDTVTGSPGAWLFVQHANGSSGMGAAPSPIAPLSETDTAWGDFDGDADLDVILVGVDSAGSQQAWWYENLAADRGQLNHAPPAPTNLAASYDSLRGGYVFSWSAPGVHTDATPEAGFGYELRVGTASGGNDVVSWSRPAGPSPHGAALERFVAVPPGAYYFDVRAVDGGWMRGASAGELRTTVK